MIIKRWLCGFLFLIGLFACERWGTLDEAKQLYFDNKDTFDEMYLLVKENRNIEEISGAYDPYGDIEFLPVYGKLDDKAKAAYADALKLMSSIALDRIRIQRFKMKDGREIDTVEFLVFTRGFLDSSEVVMIIHIEDGYVIDDLISPPSACENLNDKHWYACHLK